MRPLPFTLLMIVLAINGMIAGYALDQHFGPRADIKPNPRIAPGIAYLEPGVAIVHG